MFRSTKYADIAMIFHWAVFLLIANNIILYPEIGDISMDLAADAMTVHMGIGLTILVLMIARLVWRLTHPVPALPKEMPAWQQRAAHAVQWGLYAAIFVMVALGIAAAAFAPYAADAFGFIPLSWMAPENENIYEFFVGLHDIVKFVILALFAVHVGAALYHGVFKKDGVFRSMLPW